MSKHDEKEKPFWVIHVSPDHFISGHDTPQEAEQAAAQQREKARISGKAPDFTTIPRPPATPPTVDVTGNSDFHVIGNTGCLLGLCGKGDYPHDCSCGGLIHADTGKGLGGETTPLLLTKCDRCQEVGG